MMNGKPCARDSCHDVGELWKPAPRLAVQRLWEPELGQAERVQPVP